MTIKKLSGSFVAAMGMLVLSAPAMADDCDLVAEAIKTAATNLVCSPDGNFEGPAIWQWKGKGELGCAVHASLAKNLFEEHGDPPLNQGKSKNRPPEGEFGHGAAAKLFDHKYEEALLDLQKFWDTIEYSAKLNTDNPDAAAQAEAQQALAMDFMSMIDPILGCTTP